MLQAMVNTITHLGSHVVSNGQYRTVIWLQCEKNYIFIPKQINIQKELKPSAEGFFILSTGVAGEEQAGGTPGGKRFLQQTEVVEGFRSCKKIG